MWKVQYTRSDGYLEFDSFDTWDDAIYHVDFLWGTESTFEKVTVYKS